MADEAAEEHAVVAVARAMNRRLLALLFCAACNTTPAKPPAADGDLQVQVVRLETQAAEGAAKLLEQSLPKATANGVAFKVVVKADQNALVLSGTAAQMKEALDLVARFDVK